MPSNPPEIAAVYWKRWVDRRPRFTWSPLPAARLDSEVLTEGAVEAAQAAASELARAERRSLAKLRAAAGRR